MHSAKIATKIRERILRFSGEVSVGLPKTAARLVREVIYGVQTRGSVRLSEIARALEEKIRLKKVMARLSRQLNRQGLRAPVRENLLRLAAPRVVTETLLVVDLTDVIKPYARKIANILELLSAGHLNQIMLSLDICRKSHLLAYGGKGYAYLQREFLPGLKGAGVTDEQVRCLTVSNPGRALAVRKAER